LSRPDLFPDPAIEESAFAIAYGGSLERRAKMLAARLAKKLADTAVKIAQE
jgi:hypothetical protein